MVFSPMELQAYFQTELDAGCLNGNGVNPGQKRSLDEAAGGNGAGSGGPTAAAGAGNGNWKGNGNGNRNRNGRRRAAVTQLLLCSLLMSHRHHHLSNQWPPCKLSLLLPPSITHLNWPIQFLITTALLLLNLRSIINVCQPLRLFTVPAILLPHLNNSKTSARMGE